MKKPTSTTKRWNDWDISDSFERGKLFEKARVSRIINEMRNNLKDPDYSYSNEYIENWLDKLKEEII